MPELHAKLAGLFGFQHFRPYQEEVVRATLGGRDSFTVMPTGGGKSLCYQLPAHLLPGVCVVVSPLISLMKDQVDAARANGIEAAAYNSASSAAERSRAVSLVSSGKLDLLYVSPERLRLPDFVSFLRSSRISFFAIDEAHCISEWGHDFRPDYLFLSELPGLFPGTPIAAFTATATRRVEGDIVERLGLRTPLLTRASFNRPNLFYQVMPKEDLEKQLLDFLAGREDESGIIYRTTRKGVDATAEFLCRHGHKALAYHAGLGDAERAASQEAFRNDECRLIVATIAFGMGIDKSNVRFVVHGDLPKNLEGYYQETGRAGRDGEPAHCALFYGRKDVAQLLRFADGVGDEEARRIARTQLFGMLDFTQKEGCRRKALLRYFDEDFPGENCGGCDVCSGSVQREDATVPAQKLLSAMVRTGGRFGARHLMDILLGKASKRVIECGHDSLPTFGVGADKDLSYWNRLTDAVLAQGLAEISDPRFPVPEISARGWEVLRGQRQISIIRGAEKVQKRKRSAMSAELRYPELFELLREERKRLAQEGGVPPYVVFSDRTLREMAEQLPDTPDKLLRISGVGTHKLEAYGGDFLALLNRWLEEHPEAARPEADAGESGSECSGEPVRELLSRKGEYGGKAEKGADGTGKRGETWRETGRLLLEEMLSVEAAAEVRGLKESTIISHMEKLAQEEGAVFEPERFMPRELYEQIRELFRVCGSWQLAPVVELSREGLVHGAADKPDGAGDARDAIEAADAGGLSGVAGAVGVSFEQARLARLLLRCNGITPWS